MNISLKVVVTQQADESKRSCKKTQKNNGDSCNDLIINLSTEVPDKWTVVIIACHKTIIDYVLWVHVNMFRYPCKSVQLSSGPTTHGTIVIVKLEAVFIHGSDMASVK